MRNFGIHLILLCVPVLALQAPSSNSKRPLHQENFKTIIDRYLFIDDFTVKPPEREISEELFWKYQLPFPKTDFAIDDQIDDAAKEIPATPGSGVEFFHINRGRVLFLNGNYGDAQNTWLAGRARFGDKWNYDRRQDYFLSLVFMKIGMDKIRKEKVDWKDHSVRGILANAATFLSWALLIKESKDDTVMDQIAPKQFYNLAAIYYNYGRYGAAFGAAKKGLDYLRKTGRTEYRSRLQRILAESFIQNRSYLEAVQVFDTALRHDSDPKQASEIFARVADIYFDLNNYELAETNYALANRVDNEIDRIKPSQFVLRGEALFWLGQFSEAAKMLNYAIEFAAANNVTEPLSDQYEGFARLRLADSYLAMKRLDDAKLEYGRVSHEFGPSEAGKIAKIRSACLEMPDFGPADQDRNVEHSRNLLNSSKDMDIPEPARELAWACHVLSYTERERTPEMIARVREFYEKYPFSRRFLRMMVDPVVEVQASQLTKFIEANDPYSATQFFESTRQLLFKTISDKLGRDLFIAFMDTYKPSKATEFVDAFMKTEPSSPTKDIRLVTYYSEVFGEKFATRIKKPNAPELVVAKRLTKEMPAIPAGDWASIYLNRIKATPAILLHSAWIYQLETQWAKSDEKLTCTLVYPSLVRLLNEGSVLWDQTRREREVREFVTAQLPDMFRKDEKCAISIMELEFGLFEDRPAELANLYRQRESWPMLEDIVALYWSVAESLKLKGQHDQATAIFRMIAEKGPADSSKVRFAKLRLDKTKTEFEKIWQ